MKFESLKSSKFEAFKGDEIANPLKVTGGHVQTDGTSWSSLDGETGGRDSFTWGTDAPTQDHLVGGNRGDVSFINGGPKGDEYEVWIDG